MSKCRYPQHHKSGGRSPLPVLAAVLAAVFIASKRHEIRQGLTDLAHIAELVGLVLGAAVVLVTVGMLTARLVRARARKSARYLANSGRPQESQIRAACADFATRLRYLPAALWARVTWKWLAANLGAAYADRHRKGRVRSPRARIWPDGHGIVARVKPIPGVGRAEFERNAVHIANAWRCVRVQVSQPKPGRLIVRGLRVDPLTQPLQWGWSEKLEDVGHSGSAPELAGNLRLYVGRDEWGADRHIPLPGVTGITVGGLPGYGKTSLINSWLMQLAGLDSVQFAVIDGKGGGDYAEWEGRSFIFAGDELPAAAAALEDVHALMRTRLGSVLEVTGHKNGWHQGPTPEFPLVVVVIDECHTFFDLDAVKGNREAEAQVRACRALTGQVVKKGRSALFLVVLATQKQTSDAIPTAIRDNCRYGLSFAVKTREAAKASLGEHIAQYESFCPTTLQDPAYIGVCTASLRTGQDPFVRIRVPEVTEEAAAARAAETACKRSDPRLTPEHIADPVRPSLAVLDAV
jgi:S-DNA-T family DNA segregation ATPase FtsK/SpoIIIE